jgi:hypothetical protein
MTQTDFKEMFQELVKKNYRDEYYELHVMIDGKVIATSDCTPFRRRYDD